MKFNFLIFTIALIFLYSAAVYGAADSSMVLCLGFDDGSGNTAKDSSMYGNDGKVQGAKWVAGKYGKALEFDGATNQVIVADSKSLLAMDGGTLMAWANIYIESGHASWPRVMIKSTINGGTEGFDFLFDRALSYSIRFCVGGECNSYVPVETKAWHHVAVTYNNKMIYAYLDGKKVGEKAQLGPAKNTTGSNLVIGNGVAADRAYHGALDEIRLFDRPLDENEITKQMKISTRDLSSVDSISKLATTWADVKSLCEQR
jgi:hypothetical protein